MKKVYIQIVDTAHNTYQSACIQEPVEPSQAINNACRHFGIDSTDITWSASFNSSYPGMPKHLCMTGSVEGTPKLVTIIELDL